MKRAMVLGGGKFGLEDCDDPKVADNYAKIKIHSIPLCTEVFGAMKHDGDPRPMGSHESAGEVVEVGPKVTKVEVGDRVVVMPQNACGKCPNCLIGEHIYCQHKRNVKEICGPNSSPGGLAQYCVQQDWLLWPIADDLSYDHASMACCGMGPAFNAMQRMQVAATDTVLISGLGPVGLGAAVIACYRGARVLGLENNPYRIDTAKKIGVEAIVDPTAEDAAEAIMELTGGIGVDKSIECSSAKSAPAFLVKVARACGQIATPGWGGPSDFRPITAKGLTVHGCWHWNHLRDSVVMERTIRGARDLIDIQITHTFPMSRVEEAMHKRMSGECGKIIVHPWED